MASPSNRELTDGRTDRARQSTLLVVGQPPGRPTRIEPGAPQRLVGQQVAEPREPALVEQAALQRRPARPEGATETSHRDRVGLRSERSFVGIDLDPAEAPRVVDGEQPAVGEAQHESVPPAVVTRRAVLERVDRTDAVDQQPAGHAEPHADDGPISVEEQQLADPTNRLDRRAPQCVDHHRSRRTTRVTGVEGRDGRDGGTDDGFGRLPVHLDLDQLGHPSDGIPSWQTRRMTVLDIEDTAGVRLLTLNRPEAKNAFNEALWNATSDALEAALDDDAIGCVVITGAPGAFSAGADLAEMADPPEIPQGAQRGFYRFMDILERFDKPLVAAVNGVGVGIGLTLLPHCDLVFMARSARLKAPFVNLGVTTEAGSSASLAATMGWHDAAYAIFTASWIDAETALRSGLAWRMSEDDEVVADAMAVAREIGAMPVNALRTTKGLMLESRGDWRDARRREDEVFPSLIGSAENIAALTAFLGG